MLRKIFIGLLFILGLLVICSEIAEFFIHTIGWLPSKIAFVAIGMWLMYYAYEEYVLIKVVEEEIEEEEIEEAYDDSDEYDDSDSIYRD